MIKVISFDLDDTLADKNFDNLIWFEELPRLYAKKHGVSLDDAKKKTLETYNSYSGKAIWTDIRNYFKVFGLDDWKAFVDDMKHHIKVFPEVVSVLKKLKENYTLIIVTQAPKEFYELKLEVDGLGQYIDEVFSTPVHFNQLKKDEKVFSEIVKKLGVTKEQIIHVGDHPNNDYELPVSAGIRAFLLDRDKSSVGDHVVYDLEEFYEKVIEIESSC